MDDQVKKFLKHLFRRVRQSWWLFMLSGLIFGVGLYVFSFTLTEKYSSSEIISLKDEETFNALLRDIVAPVSSQTDLKSAESYLVSSPVLKRIAIKAGYISEDSPHAKVVSAMNRIERNLMVEENSNNARIITISFTAESGEEAQKMTRLLSKELVSQVMEARTKTAELALQFIEKQLRETEDSLVVAKAELSAYKKKHLWSLPEGFIEGTRDLFKIKKALVDDEAELKETEKRLILLRKSLDEYNPQLTSLDVTLSKKLQEYEILKARYTEKHPVMRKIQAEIERIKERRILLVLQKNSETTEGVTITVGDGLKPALSFASQEQDLFVLSRKMQEQELLSEKERLEARVEEYQSILGKLEMNIQNIPEIEKGIHSREKQVEDLETQFKQLTDRFNSARHSIDVSVLNATAGYSVLTDANLPLWPSFPIKENFFFLGLFLGCFFLLTILVISEILFGRIYDVEDIESILNCKNMGELPDLTFGGRR